MGEDVAQNGAPRTEEGVMWVGSGPTDPWVSGWCRAWNQGHEEGGAGTGKEKSGEGGGWRAGAGSGVGSLSSEWATLNVTCPMEELDHGRQQLKLTGRLLVATRGSKGAS